jgi:hypothetical protein
MFHIVIFDSFIRRIVVGKHWECIIFISEEYQNNCAGLNNPVEHRNTVPYVLAISP